MNQPIYAGLTLTCTECGNVNPRFRTKCQTCSTSMSPALQKEADEFAENLRKKYEGQS